MEKLTGSPTKPSDLWAIVCCYRGKSAFPIPLRPLRLCLDLTPRRAPDEHLVPITVRFELRGRFQVWFGFAHSRQSLAIKMSSRQVRPDYSRASILMLSTARRGRPHRGGLGHPIKRPVVNLAVEVAAPKLIDAPSPAPGPFT